MNNLQHLYDTNKDFHAFVNSHLVVFEKWYASALDGESIDDDIEAEKWLMGPSNGSDYDDGRLPEPCLRIDFGNREYRSIETGDGTGFVQLSNYELIGRDALEGKMSALISSLSNGMISKPFADNSVIESIIDEEYEVLFDVERKQAVNAYETLKLHASKVKELLVKVYAKAVSLAASIPDGDMTAGDLEELNDLYFEMQELGIGV